MDGNLIYWINYWVGLMASLSLGSILGYLYREKTLFDHKKGKHVG
jgi:hypothetical protein